MKNLKSLLLILAISLGIISCEKDESTNPISSTISSSEIADGAQLAKSILNATYTKYANISDDEFIDKATPIRDQLKTNKRLSSDKSGNDNIPLGDIFFFYEGAINNIHILPFDPESEVETYTSTFTVDIFQEDNQYFITTEDYNTFYTQVSNNINQTVNLNANEYLALADLNLDAINGGTATISATLIVGSAPPAAFAPLYPSGEVHGAQLAGWCGIPTSAGIDASDFIEGHINGSSVLVGFTCTGTLNPWPLPLGNWYSATTPQSTLNNIIGASTVSNLDNFFWHDATNSCIGNNTDQFDNEAQWLGWYNKINTIAFDPDALSHFGIVTSASNMGLLIANVNAQSGNPPYPNTSSSNFYHEGRFFYGAVFCR